MRVAILTHSTNPRGGVVHALHLGEALTALGHEAVVHAPDATGAGFFRAADCPTVAVPARRAPPGVTAMVHQRIGEYLDHFDQPTRRRFDTWLAGDGISGNALATLREAGAIRGFARTVHYLDAFADPALMRLQARSILAADRHFTVSRLWQERLRRDWGVAAAVVGNGVDGRRFHPSAVRDTGLAHRLGITGAPVLLAVGGVEARKNALGILEAFIALRRERPDARLVIAGGASVLDHTGDRQRFAARRVESGLPADAVLIPGPIAEADMPALYRLADLLVFPSLQEGFGLVVLEAMACGVPVVVSRIPPFTEYLGAADVAWCDPVDPVSIAVALRFALEDRHRARLSARGPRVAARFGWDRVARAYLAGFAAREAETLCHA